MIIETSRHKVRHFAYEAKTQGSPVTLLVGDGPTRCSAPRWIGLNGSPDPVNVKLGLEVDRRMLHEAYVRCRKCPECLKHRARLWTARAIDETKCSRRTWFGTLTLSPERQTWARYSALKRLGERVSDVTDDNVFTGSVSILGDELTKFLKRVRKVSPFRYLLVTEPHQSGLPHFHMLIHEHAGNITKRVLEDRWRFGFSHWRLIDTGNEKAAGYVCKYLSKDARTRIRASEKYGQTGAIRSLTERLAATRDTLAELERKPPAC